MPKVKIWHNPRCSKSRQALALLEEMDVELEIRRYLDDIPSVDELQEVATMLGMTAREWMRSKESIAKELNLKSDTHSEEDIFSAMHTHPKLIERPIVIVGDQAKLGRPPEALGPWIETLAK